MICIMGGRPHLAHGALISAAGEALRREGEVYIVVPKQLTLQTELDLIRALEPGGSFRLNVLSPERLCARIFDTAGKPEGERVDDRGRVMLARRALNACEKQLKVYSGAGHRRGFPARAARQLEILRQAGMTPKEVRALAAKREGLFAAKLTDMAQLLEQYLTFLDGGYLDGEGVFLAAAEEASASQAARCAGMVFYGFDLMPRPLHKLIAALGAVCPVTLIFAADPDSHAPDADLYLAVNRSIGRLRDAAREAGAEIVSRRMEETGAASRPGDLTHLCDSLFARKGTAYAGPREGVSLISLKDPASEAAYVAGKCRELAMAGARWNDMMVVCEDLSGYGRCLQDAFSAFEIPLFLSTSRPASRHPLAEAVLSALRLIEKGFRTEDALALLRTGYIQLNNPDSLANYLVKYEPRGKGLTLAFVRGGDEAAANEEDRKALMEPVCQLRENLRKAENLRGQLTAIFDYMQAISAYETSLARQEKLTQAGLNTLAGEESQVWNRILSTLDQTALLMGEKRLSLEDLFETLREGLDAAVIKPLPQSGDAVAAQSLDAAVFRSAKYLFFVGLTDRVYADMDGLFTGRQTEEMSRDAKKYLCPDATEKALMRRYYFKTALEAAGERVVFTYPISGQDGSAQRGAPVLGEIRRLLPNLPEEGGLEQQEKIGEMLLSAPGAALKQAGGALDTEAGRRAFTTIAQMGGEKVKRLLAAFDPAHDSQQLQPDTARQIYGALNSASVTRLELFGKCPFAHFMRYAISPQRTEPFRLTPRDEGGFFHDALRAFLAGAGEEMTPQAAQARMDEISDLLLTRMDGERRFDTAVSQADRKRLKRTARSAAEALVMQLKGTGFAPVEMELEFGGADGAALKLKAPGGDCALEGRIDRIDEWKGPQEDFLRIIDYKRGANELRLCEAYYGLQLQLILYLAAAMRRRQDEGAGVYYFRIDEGIVSEQSTDEWEVAQQRRKHMKLSGLTINDKDVVAAMEPMDGDVINIRVNTDGSIARTSPVVEKDALGLVIDRAMDVAASHVGRIRAGFVRPSPARTKRTNPCKFCDHKNACLFDEALHPEDLRRLTDMRDGEVVEKLKQMRNDDAEDSAYTEEGE